MILDGIHKYLVCRGRKSPGLRCISSPTDDPSVRRRNTILNVFTLYLMACIFPIFLECKEWTLDPYWQDIFTSCAYGKFPKGLRMTKDGTLSIDHHEKGKSKSEKGRGKLSQDPFEAFQTMMDIFKKDLKLVSDRESRKQHKEIDILKEKYSEYQQVAWKQIKPKNIKIMLLTQYVLDCQEKYSLSPEKTRLLLSMIKLGFMFKTIRADDIDYSDGVIHYIDGITFTEGDFEFDVFEGIQHSEAECAPPQTGSQATEGDALESCRQTFEKYIKDYKNTVIKLM